MEKQSPKYRRQKKPTGDLAFVQLNGQRYYLGKYDSPESWQQYHQLLAQYHTGNQYLPQAGTFITIYELINQFRKHAESHYRRADGSPTSEQRNFKIALRPLKALFGHLTVDQFSPLKLQAVRDVFIARKMKRKSINHMVGRIKRVFKWGVSLELVPAAVIQALDCVAGLQRGRSAAVESTPVMTVPPHRIAALEPYVSRQVWTLIQLQILTGARSGELVCLRAIDIDTSGDIWKYQPADHKTAYRGRDLMIPIGPKAQTLLKPGFAPIFWSRVYERVSAIFFISTACLSGWVRPIFRHWSA